MVPVRMSVVVPTCAVAATAMRHRAARTPATRRETRPNGDSVIGGRRTTKEERDERRGEAITVKDALALGKRIRLSSSF
jgi:hypothetical protein